MKLKVNKPNNAVNLINDDLDKAAPALATYTTPIFLTNACYIVTAVKLNS